MLLFPEIYNEVDWYIWEMLESIVYYLHVLISVPQFLWMLSQFIVKFILHLKLGSYSSQFQ